VLWGAFFRDFLSVNRLGFFGILGVLVFSKDKNPWQFLLKVTRGGEGAALHAQAQFQSSKVEAPKFWALSKNGK
jgi:hypothetical protein